MKLWKARLNLICMDCFTYDLNFNFELLEKDYEVHENYNEWIHHEPWIADRVPMEITITTSYGNVSATQGFDYKLDKNELEKVKNNMKKAIKEKIDEDMEMYKKAI